jgi:hypothetical protein
MQTLKQTIDDFIDKHHISMAPCKEDYDFVPKDDLDWNRSASHWKCTLRRGRKSLTIGFHMGSAHTGDPVPSEVLHSLALDSQSFDNATSFEDWCRDYGYDAEIDDDEGRLKRNPKAWRIWKAVEAQSKKLHNLLGEELIEELYYDTEPL